MELAGFAWDGGVSIYLYVLNYFVTFREVCMCRRDYCYRIPGCLCRPGLPPHTNVRRYRVIFNNKKKSGEMVSVREWIGSVRGLKTRIGHNYTLRKCQEKAIEEKETRCEDAGERCFMCVGGSALSDEPADSKAVMWIPLSARSIPALALVKS